MIPRIIDDAKYHGFSFALPFDVFRPIKNSPVRKLAILRTFDRHSELVRKCSSHSWRGLDRACFLQRLLNSRLLGLYHSF